MNAVDLFVALRRRWRVIAILIAATVAVAWITTPAQRKGAAGTVTWQASQTLYTDGAHGLQYSLDRMASYLTGGPVPEAVARQMGTRASAGSAGSTAKGSIRSIAIGSTTVDVKPFGAILALSVVTNDKSGVKAREVNDRLANQLVVFIHQTLDASYKENLDGLVAQYDSLGKKMDKAANVLADCKPRDRHCIINARATWTELHSSWQTIGKAYKRAQEQGKGRVSLRPSEIDTVGHPKAVLTRKRHAGSSPIPVATKPRLALGLIVGLLLGALIAFVVGKLDSSVYGVEAAETAARLPVLSEIPHVSTSRRRRFEVLTQLSPLSGVADSYRALRTSIGLMWLANDDDGRTEPNILIVASPGPNEGKSTTSANLAAAYAEMGKQVIVVDLDYRRQRLHKFLGAEPEPHLTNIGTLAEPRVDLDAITQSTSIPGVRFIGSAAPDVTPAEAAVAGRAAIRAAATAVDIVIVDTPPLLLTNDTLDLLDMADAVLLLVRDGRTKSAALARASQQLRRLDAPVLGIALIGAVSSRPGYGYGYGYGYRYGYSYGGYGYGYGMRTHLDDAKNGADATIDLTDTTAPVPVAVSELSPAGKPARRRFGVRGASDKGSDGDADGPSTS